MFFSPQLGAVQRKATEFEAVSEKAKGDLEDNEAKFQSENRKLEGSITNLTHQRDMLQQQLKESKLDLKKRLDKVKGLQKAVSEGEVEKEGLSNSMKKLQGVVERLNAARQESDDELSESRKEIAEYREKLEASQGKIADLEEELQLNLLKQGEWEARYGQLQREGATIAEARTTAEARATALQAGHDQLGKASKKEYRELELKMTTREAQIEKMEKQKESLKKELAESKEALRQSKHEFSELQKDYIDHQKNCEGFRQEVILKRETIGRLESSAHTLEVKNETLADDLARNETASELLKKQKDTVDKELQGAEVKMLIMMAIVMVMMVVMLIAIGMVIIIVMILFIGNDERDLPAVVI